ncbi:unnamed protein product [Camellia sinensis]
MPNKQRGLRTTRTQRHHLHCNHKIRAGKEFKSSPPCQAIFKYLIPTLVALLAMKYNGKTENPFEAHPANMWTFFIAICIYCLALGLIQEMKIDSAIYTQMLGYLAIISGTVSCVSLISIFLPDLPGKLVLWVLLPIILAGILLKQVIFCCPDMFGATYLSIKERISNAIDWVRDKFNSVIRNLIEQPSLPNASCPV